MSAPTKFRAGRVEHKCSPLCSPSYKSMVLILHENDILSRL